MLVHTFENTLANTCARMRAHTHIPKGKGKKTTQSRNWTHFLFL